MSLHDTRRAELVRALPGAETLLASSTVTQRPDRTVDSARMRVELEGIGVTAAPVFLEFEERFGGLELDDGWSPITFGIHGALQRFGPDDTGGVPCVSGNLDWYYVLRPEGAVWFRELIAMAEPMRVASRVQSFVFRMLWYGAPGRMSKPSVEIRGHRGSELADLFGASFVPAASDEVQRLWESDTLSIMETPDLQYLTDPVDPDIGPFDLTRIWCDDRARLDALVEEARAQLGVSWRSSAHSDWR